MAKQFVIMRSAGYWAGADNDDDRTSNPGNAWTGDPAKAKRYDWEGAIYMAYRIEKVRHYRTGSLNVIPAAL